MPKTKTILKKNESQMSSLIESMSRNIKEMEGANEPSVAPSQSIGTSLKTKMSPNQVKTSIDLGEYLRQIGTAIKSAQGLNLSAKEIGGIVNTINSAINAGIMNVNPTKFAQATQKLSE